MKEKFGQIRSKDAYKNMKLIKIKALTNIILDKIRDF